MSFGFAIMPWSVMGAALHQAVPLSHLYTSDCCRCANFAQLLLPCFEISSADQRLLDMDGEPDAPAERVAVFHVPQRFPVALNA